MLAPRSLLEDVRRQILIRRRSLAAICLGLAVWSGIHALTAAPPAGVLVVTAARDLDSGATLGTSDLERVRFTRRSVPPTAVRDPADVLDRTLVGPLARGEPLTTGRVLGRGILAGYPDRAAVGLRIPDQDAAALLDPGDRVDLVATDPQSDAEPVVLVRDAVVLALPEPDDDAARGGVEEGRLVLFAVPRADAAHVAAIASSHFLTVIWNR